MTAPRPAEAGSRSCAAPRPAVPSRRPGCEDGSLAVLQATWLLALTLLVGVALLDVGALLRGARVAAAAADGAALAAATATRNASPVVPTVAADRVAAVHGAQVTGCRCGTPPVRVEVVRPVDTRLLVRLGLTQVRASATARLVPLPSPRGGPSP